MEKHGNVAHVGKKDSTERASVVLPGDKVALMTPAREYSSAAVRTFSWKYHFERCKALLALYTARGWN